MKKLICVMVAAAGVAAWAQTYRVTPEAEGGGDGQSWESPMTIAEAVSAANGADHSTVLLKAGRYTPAERLSFSRPFALLGGYAGTEGDALAAEPLSVLDARHAINNLLHENFQSSGSHTSVVSRIEFTGARTQAVVNSGYHCSVLRFESCRFTDNGIDWDAGYGSGGRAICIGGGRAEWSGVVAITNCFFGGNATTNAASGYAGRCGAVYLANMNRLELYDSTFVTNGVAWQYPIGGQSIGNSAGSSALRTDNVGHVAIVGCRFIANRSVAGASSNSSYQSPAVYLYNSQTYYPWSCVVSNCLFVGNEEVSKNKSRLNSYASGGLGIWDNPNLASTTTEVVNCTFAYNIANTSYGSAGMSMYMGNVRVRNSIFYGNRLYSGGTKGCDFRLATANARADIDYTLFGATALSNVCDSAGSAVDMGSHVIAGDPLFRSSYEDFAALVCVTNVNTAKDPYYTLAYLPDAETLAGLLALDVHVDSPLSPAIDAGDPSAPYDREPAKNGGRVNLGAYGNTPEAHETAVAQPTIVDDALTMTFPYSSSQPHLAFALGGEPEEVYQATAVISWTTDGENWTECETLEGLSRGFAYDKDVPLAFDEGDELTFRVTVTAYGAEPVVAEATVASVPWAKPATYGKGGGTGIFHVKADATGDGSGRDWFNAATEPRYSSAEYPHGTLEVWCATAAGTFPAGHSLNFSSFVFRGGFAGTENSLAERAEGSVTKIDGEDTAGSCISLTYSGTVVFDGFEFTRAANRGISTSPANSSTLKLINCRITANGLNWDSSYQSGGRALYIDGQRADWGKCFYASNCYFGGNACAKSSASWTGKGAVWLGSLRHADFHGCTFETNGVAWSHPLGSGHGMANAAGASAIRVENAGQLSLNHCVFRANRNGGYDDNANYPDCCVQISNSQTYYPWQCGITNCLFIANEGVPSGGVSSQRGGALMIVDSIRNTTADVYSCTFAYNMSGGTTGAAGLTVRDGNVKVRNSIFFGNRQRIGNYKGCDLRLTGATATADIDYTLFGALDVSNVCNSVGESFALGANVFAGDPKFVSSFEDFRACTVITNVKSGVTVPALPTEYGALMEAMALNAHVGADNSPAIDMGDENSNFDREPQPNGNRINLGFYGNTPEAHVTVIRQPEIVEGSLKVTFPYDYSQPHVAFALGGDDEYQAMAILSWKTNGVDFTQLKTINGLNRGAVYDEDWLMAFANGSELTVRLEVTASGAIMRFAETTVTVEKNLPASYGKGGGPTVCHVRHGATGDGSGSDWFNARTEMPRNNDDLRVAETEIWVADDFPSGTVLGSVTLPRAYTIRGGFAGYENSAAEREPGRMTRIDGADTAATGLGVTSGGDVTIENFMFTRCTERGASISRGSSGLFTVRNCSFTANGLGRADYWLNGGGRGLQMSGGAVAYGSSCCVSNCYFGGNACNRVDGNHVSGIGAVNLTEMVRTSVFDCTFETNGVAWSYPIGSGSVASAAGGGALRICNSRCCVTRCAFIGNRVASAASGNDGYCSAIVEISSNNNIYPYNNGITNCLFIGNESVCGDSSRTSSRSTGALYVNDVLASGTTDVVNCTFAYNAFATGAGSAGFSLLKGTARVKNSIFYGNRVLNGAQGADMKTTGTSGRIEVDYSIFGSLDEEYVQARDGCEIVFGEHVKEGDPKLVSSLADYERLLTPYSVGVVSFWAYAPEAAVYEEVMKLNGHLRGHCGYLSERSGKLEYRRGPSPALDAGDPADDFSGEPAERDHSTNGGRINIGAYGNTPWATMTALPGNVLRVR